MAQSKFPNPCQMSRPTKPAVVMKNSEGKVMVTIPLNRINLSRVGMICHESGHRWSQPSMDAVSDEYVRSMDLSTTTPVLFPMYLDSGVSRHMVNEKCIFDEMWETVKVNNETA